MTDYIAVKEAMDIWQISLRSVCKFYFPAFGLGAFPPAFALPGTSVALWETPVALASCFGCSSRQQRLSTIARSIDLRHQSVKPLGLGRASCHHLVGFQLHIAKALRTAANSTDEGNTYVSSVLSSLPLMLISD